VNVISQRGTMQTFGMAVVGIPPVIGFMVGVIIDVRSISIALDIIRSLRMAGPVEQRNHKRSQLQNDLVPEVSVPPLDDQSATHNS
jgi:hypothetical protein